MRPFARIVAGAIALVVLGLAGQAPAGADPSFRPAGESDAPRKGTKVTAEVVGNGPQYLRGRVKGADRRFITVQKATTCNERLTRCNWHKYEKVKGQGRKDAYRVRIAAPAHPGHRWWWRATIRGDKSRIWYTFRKRG